MRSTRTAPALDWSGPGNADAYARFADTHDWYDRLAADLVARAGIVAGAAVVDLCRGAGALTRAVLARANPASIVAVDFSAAMLDQARRRTADSRVEWCQLPAHHLARLGAATADAVLCSAAMWELPVGPTLAAAATVLRPGGRLAFNVAVDPARPNQDWAARSAVAGLRLHRVDRVEHRLSGAGVVDWLTLPIFFPGPPGLDPAARRRFLRCRGLDHDPAPDRAQPWAVVVAGKPVQEHPPKAFQMETSC